MDKEIHRIEYTLFFQTIMKSCVKNCLFRVARCYPIQEIDNNFLEVERELVQNGVPRWMCLIFNCRFHIGYISNFCRIGVYSLAKSILARGSIMIEQSRKKDLFDKLNAYINSKLKGSGAKLFSQFISQYYKNTAIEELEKRDIVDVFGAAYSHWELINSRKWGELKIHIYNPHYEYHGCNQSIPLCKWLMMICLF